MVVYTPAHKCTRILFTRADISYISDSRLILLLRLLPHDLRHHLLQARQRRVSDDRVIARLVQRAALGPDAPQRQHRRVGLAGLPRLLLQRAQPLQRRVLHVGPGRAARLTLELGVDGGGRGGEGVDLERAVQGGGGVAEGCEDEGADAGTCVSLYIPTYTCR